MNILLICNKSPWPPREGGPIAMNAIAEGLLKAGHKIKILAINSYKYNIDINSIPQEYKEKTRIELVYLDLRVRIFPALLNLFSSESYHIKRFISDKFSSALEQILREEQFDVIQLESLFITPYIPIIRKYSKAILTLRAHNIEHQIWERLRDGSTNPLKRYYLHHLAKTLKHYELKTLKEVDGIVAITRKDADFFAGFIGSEKVIAIPFGVDETKLIPNIEATDKLVSNTIFHIGSMNWLPNQEGILWFLNEVWPQLLKSNKSITFHLAGRAMPEKILNLKIKRVIIDGEVPNAFEYMQKYKIMVVPLFSGSGIRIKIIEGMMAKCAVITTSIGAEGINYINGKHLLIADSREEFIKAINMLIENPSKIYELGENASNFVVQEHSNSALILKLESFYNKLN